MERYHEMKDLAPRDIVARAIDTELKRSGDDSVVSRHHARERRISCASDSPTSTRAAWNSVSTSRKKPIPVVPAAHYWCGGVRTDLTGETDVANLFAAARVACTGLHGANRLASNSLLEALVFADAAAKATSQRLGDLSQRTGRGARVGRRRRHRERRSRRDQPRTGTRSDG